MTDQERAKEIVAHIPMECEVCGEKYLAPRYRVERGHGKTCSRSCARRKATSAFKSSRPKPSEQEMADALWARVDRRGADECWEWNGPTTREGRGIFQLKGVRSVATRAAWRITHGHWPPSDKYVCHSCDNPPCVNPAHLWLGTAQDNARDMQTKGRAGHGLAKGHGWQKRLTHCKRGHPLSGENLALNNGGRRKCRACQKLVRSEWQARQKEGNQYG